MFSKWLLAFAFAVVLSAPAIAQNPTCPTRAVGDSSNACASTAFVQNQIAASTRTKLPTGTTNFYADSSGTGCGGGGCSDSNSGLTPTTAKKTVLGALYEILNEYDFTCTVAVQSTAKINMLANEINAGVPVHFGPHDFTGACAGGSVLVDGGGFTLQYDSASAGPIAAFFGPVFQIQSTVLVNSLGPCVNVLEGGRIRFGTSVIFGNCGIGVQTKTGASAIFLNNFNITTGATMTGFINADENSTVEFTNGTTGTIASSPVYTAFMFAQKGSNISLNSVAWSGALGGGAKYVVTDSASITGGASSLPGTGGTITSGGTVDSAATPVTAGGTGVATLTGLALGNGISAFSAYAGTSCTNQFPRSLNASGVATCATVANTDLANSTITVGTTAINLGSSSTTLAGLTSITNPLYIGGSGTTGTQLTLQTTSGNGTTDALAIKGGNNGATTFATFAAANMAVNGTANAVGQFTSTQSLAYFQMAGASATALFGLNGTTGLFQVNQSNALYQFTSSGGGDTAAIQTKKVRAGGSAPALTSCGTSPSISGGDLAGEVTMGTGSPSGCVITFNVAYTSAPYCVVTWQGNPLAVQSYTVSNTAITLTQTATSSDKVNYHCIAQSGG